MRIPVASFETERVSLFATDCYECSELHKTSTDKRHIFLCSCHECEKWRATFIDIKAGHNKVQKTYKQHMAELRVAGTAPCAHAISIDEAWPSLAADPRLHAKRRLGPLNREHPLPCYRLPGLVNGVPAFVVPVTIQSKLYYSVIHRGPISAWYCSMCRKSGCHHFHQLRKELEKTQSWDTAWEGTAAARGGTTGAATERLTDDSFTRPSSMPVDLRVFSDTPPFDDYKTSPSRILTALRCDHTGRTSACKLEECRPADTCVDCKVPLTRKVRIQV